MEKSKEVSEDHIGDKLQDFSSNATLHGIFYVFNKANHVLKRVVWMLIVATLINFTVYLVINTVIKFHKYESTISMHSEYAETLNFPSVSICNINMAELSKLHRDWPEFANFTHTLFTNPNSMEFLLAYQAIASETGRYTIMEFLQHFGPQINETFIQCQFQGEDINCSNYVVNLLTEKGMCFTLNSGRENQQILKTKMAGMFSGITLTLDTRPDEYTFINYLFTGMLILIHDQSSYPRMEEKAFIVGPGQQVFISLKKEISHILSTPYNSKSCVNSEDKDVYSFYGYPYSEEQCRNQHTVDDWERDANCKFFGNHDQNGCLMSDFLTILPYLGEYIYNASKKYCDILCKKIAYDYQLSTAEFSHRMGPEYARVRQWPVTTNEEMKRRFLQIHIFYESMKYEVEEQNPSMDVGQLISNVGGQMGFYLGASVVTVMELVDFLLSAALTFANTRAKNIENKKTVKMTKVIDISGK